MKLELDDNAGCVFTVALLAAVLIVAMLTHSCMGEYHESHKTVEAL